MATFATIAPLAGCASAGAGRSPLPAVPQLDALGARVDAIAAPWSDAASALSLVRDSGEARALTACRLSVLGGVRGEQWEVVYGIDPAAVRTDSDRKDAGMLRVTERITRELDATDAAPNAVSRRFVVEGLAAGRAIVVDVPLRDGDGARWHASVNGAPIEAPLGVSHVAIELARDEATVIRIGRTASRVH